MKIIYSVIISLLFFISISFSQQVFKSDKHGFQITFPDDCRLYPDFGDVAPIAAYFEKNASINVIAKESDALKQMGTDDYKFDKLLDSVVKLYGNTFVNFKVNESGYDTISGIKFYRIMYQCDMKEKVFIASQYFTARKGKIYVISTGCFESNYEKYNIVFKDCVTSFTFLE